jgi:hypothetical protein
VIDGKYGILRGGWCSEEARGPYGMSLWDGHKVRFPKADSLGWT